MRYTILAAGLALTLFALTSAPAQPAGKPRKQERLVDQVKSSIDRGVKFLRQQQQGNGGWETDLTSAGIQGGWTSLALLALLNAGVPVDDPAMKRGLAYLRKLEPTWTYVRALQTMVYAEANQTEDLERIQKNVDWLIEARTYGRDGKFIGWSYNRGMKGTADNSNSQYAVLGLWAGRMAGATIPRDVWQDIRDFYVDSQGGDGSWPYSPQRGGGALGGSSLTMTAAGVASLLVASLQLNDKREVFLEGGAARNCGVYPDDAAIQAGLNWMRKGFQLDPHQRTYYNLYGLERVGRLSGQRFIGQHDWYREGCAYLVREQHGDGAWHKTGAWDNWPVVSSSFALLFLSKGRTPILMSKLVHGSRQPEDTDWNNDRNDLRHLTEYASKEMFNRYPLGWQTFDILRAAPGNSDDEVDDAVSELLPSPIAYFNGHKSPQFRFGQVTETTEKKALKKYVENGGFLLVEACCGSPAFDQGFKALAKELWPDSPLDYLDGEHPVWKAFFQLRPGDPAKLMGIQMGCKTVLIYSPQDLSCRWESNNLKDGRVLEAFKVGANIIAYATGMELPKPRLTHEKIAKLTDPTKIPRGYFKVGQLKHGGDWKPAPRAMANLMNRLQDVAALDVVLKTEEISVGQSALVDYKFLYMHGRGDFTFNAGDPRTLQDNPGELKHLRFNLENGGLLLADACCGKEAFDQAFRRFVTDLFPPDWPGPSSTYPYKNLKLEQVPLDDELFSKELNGEAISERNIKCRREKSGPMRSVPPFLEGVKIGNRWVIIYSKYDLGCALERHQAPDCLGYDVESAYRLAGAAVLYMLRP